MKTSNSIKAILNSEIDPAFAKRSEMILGEIELSRPKRVLDAGCGRGFYVKMLTFFNFIQEIHGIDINQNHIEKATKNTALDKRVHVQTGSIYTLPFEDNYFDVVICSEVLEHLDNDKKAVVELHRVLKKGGTLLVTVPNVNFPFLWDPLNWVLMKFFKTHINKNIWWLAGIWADHERLYSEKGIRSLLNLKFEIRNLKLVVGWCWPFSHFILYGIGKNIVERLHIDQFDRFSAKSTNTISARLAWLMNLPNDIKTPQGNQSVNIFISCKK